MNSVPISSLAGWLLTIALHGGLLLAIAWLVERGLRLAPSAREVIWRCALFGGVITASVQALAPTSVQPWRLVLPGTVTTESSRVSAQPEAGAAGERSTSARAAAPSDSTQAAGASARDPASISISIGDRAVSAPPPISAGARPMPWLPAAVLILWLAGAAIAFARLCLGLVHLRRTLARAVPLIPTADLDPAALARRAGLRTPDLYTLSDIASPFAFGHRIVVPDWAAATLAPRQLQAMLAHELAHLVRRDPQWKLAVGAWRACFWFLPFAGVAQRRLDELAELACDAFAAHDAGDAHAVAECLVACAERHVDARIYALTPAMAARASTLIQRIDHLLEGTPMSTTQPGFFLRSTMAAALIACIFGLPAIGFLNPTAQAQTSPASPPQSAGDPGAVHSNVTIFGNDFSHEMRVMINDDRHRIALVANGKIEFTADDSDIASLSGGSSASLEETRDGTTRRLEFAERDGKLERRYFVDRREQPLDTAGQTWLAALLPSLIRESGLGAEARVQRLYASGGAAAVLAEIDQIHSDYARNLYIGLLVDKGPLAAADLDRCIRLAGAIGGDYEKHQALARIFAKQKLEAAQQSTFLQQASHIHGDYELAELLTGILPRLDDNAQVRASWLDVAAHIGGDYERSRTLRALAARRDLSDAELASLLQASAKMSGDYEHSQVLSAIALRAQNPDAIAPAYAQSALKIGGDYERAQALLALIHTGKLGAAGANAVLDAAAKVGGDYERSQVLVALAQSMPSDAALVAHYREVASHLAEYERGQAENALRR